MKSSTSICIPTYNQGRFIGDAINSVLAQTVPPHEVIVSNNHSTDQTAEILDQYRGRIRLVRPSRHVGMQENFQFCAEQATGTWLCFMGSDDLLRPDHIERIEKGIRGCIDEDVLVFGGSERVDHAGRIVGRRAILSFPHRASGSLAFEKLLDSARLLLDSVAIRRTAFEAIGGFGADSLVFDWTLYLRLSATGSFLNLKRYLGRKRYWSGSGFGGSRRNISLEDWLGAVMQTYRTCMEARLRDCAADVREQAMTMLRRTLAQEVAKALAGGRSMDEIKGLAVIKEYREVLGTDAGLASPAGGDQLATGAGARQGFLKSSWRLKFADEVRNHRFIREATAFALGWR